MKAFLKIIGALITGAIILGFGFWIGTSHNLFRHMWSGSVVAESTTKAAKLSAQLGQIQDGKIDELRSFLGLELEGEILCLDSLIDWKNPTESDKTAIRIIHTIENRRVPLGYTNENPAVSARLNEIYKKAATAYKD